jgi:hypothetical protein
MRGERLLDEPALERGDGLVQRPQRRPGGAG